MIARDLPHRYARVRADGLPGHRGHPRDLHRHRRVAPFRARASSSRSLEAASRVRPRRQVRDGSGRPKLNPAHGADAERLREWFVPTEEVPVLAGRQPRARLAFEGAEPPVRTTSCALPAPGGDRRPEQGRILSFTIARRRRGGRGDRLLPDPRGRRHQRCHRPGHLGRHLPEEKLGCSRPRTASESRDPSEEADAR